MCRYLALCWVAGILRHRGGSGVGGVPGDATPGLAGCVRHPTEADVMA